MEVNFKHAKLTQGKNMLICNFALKGSLHMEIIPCSLHCPVVTSLKTRLEVLKGNWQHNVVGIQMAQLNKQNGKYSLTEREVQWGSK